MDQPPRPPNPFASTAPRPPNPFAARPPNPFASAGPPLGLGGLSISKSNNKPKPPPPIFGSTLDAAASNPQSPAAIMRTIDNLRYHTPTPSEQTDFNLSSSRLCVHELSNFLSLCGSRKGCRFTTKELLSFKVLVQDLESNFQMIDKLFKEMTKKGGLYCLLPTPNTNTNTNAALQTAIFAYTASYSTAVSIATTKRQGLSDTPTIETDPEAELKLANPLPNYLVVLFEKYKAETDPRIPRGMLLDSLVRFSAFLAAVTVRAVSCTSKEEEAMRFLVGGSEASANENENDQNTTEQYWRRRYFGFLKSARELKAVSKKEKDLEVKSWD